MEELRAVNERFCSRHPTGAAVEVKVDHSIIISERKDPFAIEKTVAFFLKPIW